MMRASILIAAAVCLAPLAAGAAAHDRTVRTTVVRIGDLDLATGRGVDRTIGRLRGAIDDLCDSDERCRDEAWLSADWQVARYMADAQWRRRIHDERSADRTYYGWHGEPLPDEERMPPPPAREDWAPPPPPPPMVADRPPVASVTTTTTTTTVTTTTAITLVYRTPPPDYGWYPH